MAKEWYEAALKRLWTSALNDTGVLRAKVCTDEVLHNIAVTTHPYGVDGIMAALDYGV